MDDGLRAAIDGYVEATRRRWGVPGMTVAVAHQGRPLMMTGYGVRELGRPEPIGVDTVVAIASLTKAFTATGLALLVDEGRLSWDDPVSRHLPTFQLRDPWLSAAATVRDLLAHRLSIREILWNGLSLDRDALIRGYCHFGPPQGFRDTFVYSNIPFLAAGQIAAVRSGLSWDEFTRSRLLAPLGMTSSSTSAHDLAHAVNRSSSHITGLDGATFVDAIDPTGEWTMDNHGPAGSITSTTVDMMKWLLFNLGDGGLADGRRLVAPATFAALRRPAMLIEERNLPHSNFSTYALGWTVDDYRGHQVVWHDGLFRGQGSFMLLLPAERSGVFVFGNHRDVTKHNLGLAVALWIADRLLGHPVVDWAADKLGARTQALAEAAAAQAAFIASREAGTEPSRPLADLVGRYEDAANGGWDVSLEAGQLVAYRRHSSKPYWAHLSHWHHDSFEPKWSETNPDYFPARLITFETGADGTLLMVFDSAAFGRLEYPRRGPAAGEGLS